MASVARSPRPMPGGPIGPGGARGTNGPPGPNGPNRPGGPRGPSDPRASATLQPAWYRTPLGIGLILSLVVHSIVMILRFAPPEPIKFSPYDSQIEVVLLNAKTNTAPLKAEVLAQVNQEGGGDRDQGRATSPLPAEDKVVDGDELKQQTRRISQLEEQQRKMLSLARGPQTFVEPDKKIPDTKTPALTGSDDDSTQAISRLQAQIDRQISDYNKRPKRLTYGVNAKGVSYARYVDEWADKIERIGTERYPQEARGKMYDSLICTVEIDKFGNVIDIVVNKPSKFPVLNRAVKQIVHAGAPYSRFPAEMAREGDILQIVRTWTFTNKGLETSVVKGK